MKEIQLTNELHQALLKYLETRPFAEVRAMVTMLEGAKKHEQGFKLPMEQVQGLADYLVEQPFKFVAGFVQQIMNAQEVPEPEPKAKPEKLPK